MPTIAERLETATTTLEGLVANTTGTGDIVLKTSPVLVTPTLGVASATSLTASSTITVGPSGAGVTNFVITPTSFTQAVSGVSVLVINSAGRVTSQGGLDAANSETNQRFAVRFGSIIGYDEFSATTFSVSSTTGIVSAGTWQGSVVTGTYGGTGVNNGSNTITLGGNITTGGLFATVGTFSSGGNFATGGTFSTGGTFTTVGDFTAGGAFTTSHAFTTTGGAVTLTLTGTTNVTLPTAGTLATLAGAETLTGKTLSDPVFSFGNDALVASVIATKQDRDQSLHYNASFWNTATISGVATHGLSSCVAYVAVGASTNGFGRCTYSTVTFSNPFSASISTVDFSQSWLVSFRAMFRVGTNASARITLCFGVAQTHATHALTSRGFSVSVKGTGSAAELFLSAHNGTSQTSGTAVAFTANSSESDDYALYWKAGTGLYLYRNGTLLASVTAGLPSGSGTSGNTCVSQLAENVSGSGTPVDAYLIGCRVRRL